ncbi:molecular chaperone TorD [Endozoicomonadaceae bacterium StTr2]
MSDATSENRAQVYWWLSSLIASELDDAQLAHLFSDEMDLFISALGEEPELETVCEQFRQAVTALKQRQDFRLELAADYAHLFLATAKNGALPYPSVYASDKRLLMQEPHHQMLKLLNENDFARAEGFKEPADHLAIILDLMGNLALKENVIAYQQSVLQSLLLNWLPEWHQDVCRHDAFGFYAAVAALVTRFCKADLTCLQTQEGN